MHKHGARFGWLMAGALSFLSCQAASSVKVIEEFIEPAPLQPEVHASTLVEAAPGVWFATWFAGSKEGNVDVTIWGAKRTATGWEAAREIVKGVGPSGEPVPAYNPVLFAPAAGRLALVHSAGWEGKPWTPYLQWSTDEGATWSSPARLPAKVRGPDRNQPIRLASGDWLHPSTRAGGVHVEISDAAMERWEVRPKLQDPAQLRALQPTLLDHGGGKIQMLCRTYRRELATAWSHDHGRTWSELASLGITLANSAIDATRLPDGRFVLVYNPSGPPPNERAWGERHPITVAISTDGVTWRKVVDLETAAIRDGYAYPCVVVGSDGLVHLTYTWGRKRIRYVVLDPSRFE